MKTLGAIISAGAPSGRARAEDVLKAAAYVRAAQHALISRAAFHTSLLGATWRDREPTESTLRCLSAWDAKQRDMI